jgi:hypothetical protein
VTDLKKTLAKASQPSFLDLPSTDKLLKKQSNSQGLAFLMPRTTSAFVIKRVTHTHPNPNTEGKYPKPSYRGSLPGGVLAFLESLESALSGGATLCEYLSNLKVDTSSPALFFFCFFFFTGLKVREHCERHLWESASLKKLKPFINCVTTALAARGETECICGEG